MKITLASPTLTRYALLQGLLESAERGTLKPDRYFIIDNGGKLHAKLASGEIKLPSNTIVANPGHQISVAAAWNLALRECPDDYVIISNDDVTLQENTIELMVRAAEEHPEVDFFFPSAGQRFSLFLMRHTLLDKIGPFDERFFPAYFEDNDYHYRMKLAGIKELEIVGTSYGHVVSATLKAMDIHEQGKHHENFERCQRLYINKWGNVPGHETFDKPKA